MRRIVALFLTLFLSFAVAAPATQTDLEPVISVSIELDTPIEEMRYGSPVRLRCVVVGLEEPYCIRWQCSPDAEEWTDLPCTDEVFEFVLDQEDVDLYYRVVITRGEGETSGKEETEGS